MACVGQTQPATFLAAAPVMIAARRNICRACEHATRNPDPKFAPNAGLTTRSRCGSRGCHIAAKTRNALQACPIAKWHAATIPQPTPGGAL